MEWGAIDADQCKGPEAGPYLVCLKNSEDIYPQIIESRNSNRSLSIQGCHWALSGNSPDKQRRVFWAEKTACSKVCK